VSGAALRGGGKGERGWEREALPALRRWWAGILTPRARAGCAQGPIRPIVRACDERRWRRGPSLTYTTSCVLKVGDIAPEIDAVTNTGERFVLSRAPSICTVVYFFPKAFTRHCTLEAQTFSANHNELLLAGASLVGVSTDDNDTQCEFAKSVGAVFPMIPDVDRAIARSYGVLWPIVGMARRVTYVVSTAREIVAKFHHEFAVDQHRDGVLSFVHEYTEAVRRRSRELWRAELSGAKPTGVPGKG